VGRAPARLTFLFPRKYRLQTISLPQRNPAPFGDRSRPSILDVARERRVNEAIRQLKLTRVIIAHGLRPSPGPTGPSTSPKKIASRWRRKCRSNPGTSTARPCRAPPQPSFVRPEGEGFQPSPRGTFHFGQNASSIACSKEYGQVPGKLVSSILVSPAANSLAFR